MTFYNVNISLHDCSKKFKGQRKIPSDKETKNVTSDLFHYEYEMNRDLLVSLIDQ